MVREGIEHRPCCREYIFCLDQVHGCRRQRRTLAHPARSQNDHTGSIRLDEFPEDDEIPRVSLRVIALRRASHLRKGGLVHELRRRDAAANGFGIVQNHLRLARRPDARRIAGPCAGGKRGHDLRIHGTRKIDNALPFLAREHVVEALRWTSRRGTIEVLKVSRVHPRAADAKISRTQRRRQLAQPCIAQIDRRAVFKERWVHPSRRSHGRGRRLQAGSTRILPNVERLPEAPSGHFNRLNIVGLKAFINRSHASHRARRNRNAAGGRRGHAVLTRNASRRTQQQHRTKPQIHNRFLSVHPVPAYRLPVLPTFNYKR